jgi:hypothetical protein
MGNRDVSSWQDMIASLLAPPAPDVPTVPFGASKTGQLMGGIGQGLGDMFGLPARSFQASRGLQQTGQLSDRGAMDNLAAGAIGLLPAAGFPKAIYPTSAVVNDLMPAFKPFSPKVLLDETPRGAPPANLNRDVSKWVESSHNPNGSNGPSSHNYLTDSQGRTIATVSQVGNADNPSYLAQLWSPYGQGTSAVTYQAHFTSDEMAKRYLQSKLDAGKP